MSWVFIPYATVAQNGTNKKTGTKNNVFIKAFDSLDKPIK
jgi:hypothetical protein